jgi:hypothetical protein
MWLSWGLGGIERYQIGADDRGYQLLEMLTAQQNYQQALLTLAIAQSNKSFGQLR